MTAGRSVYSKSRDWCTPRKYVDLIDRFFGTRIELDPCSNRFSKVDARMKYDLPEHDGLKESWNFRTIYVNPPYGADREHKTTIKDWLYRCAEANLGHESEVLALVPVAANTSHWKEYVWGRATAVCFLYDTRLRFAVNGEEGGKGAPMACAMIYWGPRVERFTDVFLEAGAVIDLRPLKGRVIGRRGKLTVPTKIDKWVK